MFQIDIFQFQYIFVLIQLVHDNLPLKKSFYFKENKYSCLTRTKRIFENISIESRLYGSIVRASSQHVRANCNSKIKIIIETNINDLLTNQLLFHKL